MNIRTLLHSIPVFQELMGMKIDFDLGYKIQKITQEIDLITGSYDKARGEKLEEFGILSEDGKQYTFEDDTRAAYDAAMEEIETQEIGLKFDPISATLFSGIDIEPGKIKLINWMLID